MPAAQNWEEQRGVYMTLHDTSTLVRQTKLLSQLDPKIKNVSGFSLPREAPASPTITGVFVEYIWEDFQILEPRKPLDNGPFCLENPSSDSQKLKYGLLASAAESRPLLGTASVSKGIAPNNWSFPEFLKPQLSVTRKRSQKLLIMEFELWGEECCG